MGSEPLRQQEIDLRDSQSKALGHQCQQHLESNRGGVAGAGEQQQWEVRPEVTDRLNRALEAIIGVLAFFSEWDRKPVGEF